MDYEYSVRSPGRVNLIGEHTDYTYGYVMPLATDLHTSLEATPTDGEVTIHSEALGKSGSFAIDDPTPEGDWLDYVRGCYAILHEEGYEPTAFEGRLGGTLPLGSGLSSSASLELAVLAFLNEASDLGLSREELATLGQRVENDFVGVSCGIMDQFAVALGEDGHALQIDTETLEYDRIPVPDGVEIVVFHTGVEHELVDSEYNQRRETVEAALAELDATSSKAVSEDDLDDLPAGQRQRLGYVVRENNRVERARAVLEAGDIDAFGEILVDAHRDIATNYEASCPELDYFVDRAVEAGAYGARLTGAGWGGSAIALVDEGKADAFAETVSDAYHEQFPDLEASYHVVTPSSGVTVERND